MFFTLVWISLALLQIKVSANYCLVDLLYVVDSSGSISNSDFATIKQVLLNTSDLLEPVYGTELQVGILQYGDNSAKRPNYASISISYYKTPLTLGECNTTTCYREAINTNMNHMYSPKTYTALAIERSVKLEFPRSQSNSSAKKILILITDGIATDSSSLMKSYNLTEANNITVYAVGIGYVYLSDLRISANGGMSNDRVYNISDFTKLNQVIRTIIESSLADCISTTLSPSSSSIPTMTLNKATTFTIATKNKTLTTAASATLVQATEIHSVRPQEWNTSTTATEIEKYISLLANLTASHGDDTVSLQKLTTLENSLRQLSKGNYSSQYNLTKVSVQVVVKSLTSTEGTAKSGLVNFDKSSVNATFQNAGNLPVAIVMFEAVFKSNPPSCAFVKTGQRDPGNRYAELSPKVFTGVSGYDIKTGARLMGSVAFSRKVTNAEQRSRGVCQNNVISTANLRLERVDYACSFIDGSSAYSTTGCRSKVISDRVHCECDHLTVFSILLSMKTRSISLGVKILSYIFESISVCFLVFSFVLLLRHKRHIASDRTLIQLCVVFSLLLFHVANLLQDAAILHEVGCVFLSATIQYFLIASVCWFTIDGIKMTMAMTNPIGFQVQDSQKRSKVFLVVGWFIPALLVGSALAAGLPIGKYMKVNTNNVPQGGSKFDRCWLDPGTNVFILTVIVPIAICLVVNFLFSLICSWVLLSSRKNKKRRSPEEMDQDAKTFVGAFFFLMLVLGTTWVLGFFTGIGDKMTSEVMTYIHTLVNGLQGLAVFYCYCFKNDVIRKGISGVGKIPGFQAMKL